MFLAVTNQWSASPLTWFYKMSLLVKFTVPTKCNYYKKLFKVNLIQTDATVGVFVYNVEDLCFFALRDF
jgi:hypothetical protein